MTEDATVAAEAAELEADAQATNQALAQIQEAFGQLQQEVATGQASVSDATMAALQQAVTDIHAAAGAGTADAAADQSAAAGTATPAPGA